MFDGRWRESVDTGLQPVGSRLRLSGITPNQLTTGGLLISVACAVAIGAGHLWIGLALFGLAALPDLLDGAVARASNSASPRGAFFDSVADRVTDSFMLGGIAWYLASRDGSHAAMLPFALMAITALIPYERAKAESLGFSGKGGIMERAERIILLAIGIAFSSLLVPILWVMLVLTTITALQRFVKVWRQASGTVAKDRVRTTERWEAWRESTAQSFQARRAATAQRRARRRQLFNERGWRRHSGTRP